MEHYKKNKTDQNFRGNGQVSPTPFGRKFHHTYPIKDKYDFFTKQPYWYVDLKNIKTDQLLWGNQGQLAPKRHMTSYLNYLIFLIQF